MRHQSLLSASVLPGYGLLTFGAEYIPQHPPGSEVGRSAHLLGLRLHEPRQHRGDLLLDLHVAGADLTFSAYILLTVKRTSFLEVHQQRDLLELQRMIVG